MKQRKQRISLNLTAALATGQKDAVLVVGVFLELGEVESPIVQAMASVAPRLQVVSSCELSGTSNH